jgi:hypothetical protein
MSGDHPVDGSPLPPLQQRVLLALEAEIAELPAGTRLPSQKQLAARHGVSRDTVQRALADLRTRGLIESSQGKGSFVAESGPGHSPSPAGLALGGHLEAAFAADEVTIDSLSFTAQTLSLAMDPIVTRLQTQLSGPRSIRMRLLLPDPRAELAIPRRVDEPDDPRPRERLGGLIASNAVALRNRLLTLPQLSATETVRVELRTIPITPLFKVYILNGKSALYSLYEVVQNPVLVPVGHDPTHMETIAIHDSLGLHAGLFRAGDAFLEAGQRWFDSLWSTIARDFVLPE